jgi:hypothetical protein
VEVRDVEGRFLFHATMEQAHAAIAAGVAEPVGQGLVKYLRLRRSSSFARLNGGDFTQRPRNHVHEFLGGPWLRKHKDALHEGGQA